MKLRKILSSIFVFGLFLFLFLNIYSNWNIISSIEWKVGFEDILLLVLFATPIFFLNAVSWHILTKLAGLDISLKDNLRIWLVSNFARFIPGSVWQYFGRVYLMTGVGVPKGTALYIVVLEALFSLLLGLSLAALLIPTFLSELLGVADRRLFLLPVSFIGLILVILLNSRVVNWIVGLIALILKKDGLRVTPLNNKWLFPVFFLFCLQFIFSGMVLFSISRMVHGLDYQYIPFAIGSFSVSWVAGYITLFSPAGLGIQEMSIAGLLSRHMPFAVASLVAIGLRLVLLSVEAASLAILFFLNRGTIDLGKQKQL